MEDSRQFYQVIHDHYNLRTSDHLEHGYEEESEYRKALRLLVGRWRDRIGEAIDERHEFLLLRFHDTPGGVPDEAWLPRLVLKSVPVPDYMCEEESSSSDSINEELDKAFGFD
jgi:hypothetical protein